MGTSGGRVTKRRRARGARGGDRGGGSGGGGGRRRPPKGESQRASKVAARERAAAERKRHAAERCAAGRRKKELDEKAAAGRAPAEEGSAARKRQLKKKKRVRGQSAHFLTVLGPGDAVPRELGGPRASDLPTRPADDDRLPRKTRELLALIGKLPPRDAPRAPDAAAAAPPAQPDAGAAAGAAAGAEGAPAEPAEKKVKFDGMQRGETFIAFKKRLAAETRQARIDAARAGNRQRAKKKAFYERRRQRAERRAQRRRGVLSDDDDGEADGDGDWDGDAGGFGGQSVSLMADMLRERIADQKRARKPRRARDRSPPPASAQPQFGEFAMHPPDFSARPVRPGRGGVPQKLVLSDAAAVLGEAQ